MYKTNLLKDTWQQLEEYFRLSDAGDIARRYFAMNAFDGTLTMIGVLMGNLIAGVESPYIVVRTGLSTAVAMGVSGLWGAWLTESAERKRELAALNRHTLTDLVNTRIGRSFRFAVVVVALVDGLSPLLASLLILTPFLAAGWFPDIFWIYSMSIALALLTLFGLGLFLGYISRERMAVYGVKTVFAGVVSIVISLLIDG